MMKKHINGHSSETASLMEAAAKPSILRNVLVKALVFCVFVICFRFAYVVTIRGESCDVGDFCFFNFPETLTLSTTTTTTTAIAAVVEDDAASIADRFLSSIFEDLMSEGFLSPKSKSLVADTAAGKEVRALKELGVVSAVGVSKKANKPLVVGLKNGTNFPFESEAFDFVFAADGETTAAKFAAEIQRTMKPEGYLVVHTKSNDTYSLHSFIALFNSCTFIKFRDIDNDNVGYIREIVMKKEYNGGGGGYVNNNRECEVVPGFKQGIVRKAENLTKVEPLKPWITLKRNIQNIKYLPDMVDISFKSRYVYVDVGARSYGSSIGSWFRKQYPKQNKTFEIYAIEADKSFYQEYEAKKKKVQLLPYAAWVRNETLFFEVNHDPGDDAQEKGASGRGMGRIKPVQSDKDGGVDKIHGFDFAEWLKATVTDKDFVVMKMDVEGTEFDLIPRLIETGAICLIDEIFLECHYNRWQRCCPGVRSAKYEKTYGQCLNLFNSLRARGVLVHQWW